MKQKQGLDLAAVILLLLIACAALAVPVALLSPKWLIAPAVLVVAALGVLWYQRRRLRTFVAKNLCSTDFENSRIQYSLTGLPIPTMLIADGRVLWYNTIFREEVLNGTDAVTRPIDRLFPELDLAVCSRPHGQDLTVGNKRFTAYAGAAKGSRGANIVYLVDDTVYKQTLEEYTASRPACLIIVIDSYDELFDDMKDSEQAKELEAINSLLEAYIAKSTGFLRKISNSRYIAVVEERDIHWMLQERFEILDQVRALHPGGFTTLSIGVGHGGKTLQECHQMARESIDIALGRGGDQAAVKTVDGFEFYGGISHGVEKRSHVRSRIIANALCDLIKKSDSVIIMGHRMSDLDAIGSAHLQDLRRPGGHRRQQRRHPGRPAAEDFHRCRRGTQLHPAGPNAGCYHAPHAADCGGYLPEAPAGKPENLRKVQARCCHRSPPHGGRPYRQPAAALPRALRLQCQRTGV